MKNVLVKDGGLFVVPNSACKAENIVEKIQNLVKKANISKITVDCKALVKLSTVLL